MNKYTFSVIVENFVNTAKQNIIELANREIENSTKKEKLDKAMKAYLLTLIGGVKVNFVVKWFIKKFVIDNIPAITQAIYDLLKDKIEGITK